MRRGAFVIPVCQVFRDRPERSIDMEAINKELETLRSEHKRDEDMLQQYTRRIAEMEQEITLLKMGFVQL